jgi:hypothetical protein
MKVSEEMEYKKMIKTIKWVAVVFLTFALALGLLGCGGGQGYNSPATGNIAGTVKDDAGVAILGATVVVEEADLSAITDADGYYLLENIPAGTYDVAASAYNYYPQAATVIVEKGKIATQDFTPQAIQTYTVSYTVSGTVTDKDTEEPIVGAMVIIKGTGWSATTEDDGSYSISDVEAGTYDITASKSGYINQTETITVEDDITVDFELIALVQYDLTIVSTAGVSVTIPGEGTFTYDAGTVVDLVVTPGDGYQFVEWTGDVDTIADVEAAATNITMNGDYAITASSVAVYDLTISSTEGGSVITPGEGTFTYDAGTVVDLAATPGDGYRFVEWTGDVGTIVDVNAAATDITMSGNYSITANFAMEATEVKVDSITYATFGSGKHLNIIVTLLDDLGDPVAGASVSATLYRDDESSWDFQGKTNSDGIVTFKLHKHEPGCYHTEVTAVAAEGLKWDGVTPKNGYCYKESIGIEEIPYQTFAPDVYSVR